MDREAHPNIRAAVVITMDGDGSHRKALSLAFLISILLAVQTLGTMATTMLPAVAPKVAETYGVHSSLTGYARASVMSSTPGIRRGWKRERSGRCKPSPACHR